MTEKLRGIVPPLVTPLTNDGAVDVEGLSRMVEHVLSGGVHGLFILGTTGEGPALGQERQRTMISETVRAVAGRRPVLVGVSAAALTDAIRMARYAAEQGAQAVVATPSFYFQPTEAEIVEGYERLAREAGLPVFVYNMPAMTKVHLAPTTVTRLAEIRGVSGYKDSSGNMIDFQEVIRFLRDRDDFSLFTGPEELLAETVLMGGDGGVSGGANLAPGQFVAQYEAARSGDLARVRALREDIFRQRALYGALGGQSGMIRALKYALERRGLCGATTAAPWSPLNDTERARVDGILLGLRTDQ